LLISKYALDCKKYNESNDSVSWQDCSLRSWMNSTFLNEAFSTREKIILSEDELEDKVSILSIDFVEQETTGMTTSQVENYRKKYLRSLATQYSIQNGNWVSSETENKGYCVWWIKYNNTSEKVNSINVVGTTMYDRDKTTADVGVRPVVWIRISN